MSSVHGQGTTPEEPGVTGDNQSGTTRGVLGAKESGVEGVMIRTR